MQRKDLISIDTKACSSNSGTDTGCGVPQPRGRAMPTVTTFGIKNGVAGSGAAGVARPPHRRDGPGGNLAGYPV